MKTRIQKLCRRSEKVRRSSLIVCYEIAATSSRCDLLMEYLNAVRGQHIVQHPDHEEATRMDMELTRLEVYLRQLNCGQGLGFKLFGKVADRKTLLVAFTSLGSVLASVTVYLVAVGEADDYYHSHNAMCVPSVEEEQGLRAWHSMANTSCTYNISVGPGFVSVAT